MKNKIKWDVDIELKFSSEEVKQEKEESWFSFFISHRKRRVRLICETNGKTWVVNESSGTVQL